MKNTVRIIFVLVVWIGAPYFSMAATSDFEIHGSPKKVDEAAKKGSEGGHNTTKEHYVYEVTIENKTFKEVANLEVKYVIFVKREKLGVKAEGKPDRQEGSFSIAALKPHEKQSFSTNPVELKKANLVGAYYYPNGAKPNAQDTLVGLGVRIFQNGQQLAEFANPSNLTKEKWD